jgi:hypothetical protein
MDVDGALLLIPPPSVVVVAECPNSSTGGIGKTLPPSCIAPTDAGNLVPVSGNSSNENGYSSGENSELISPTWQRRGGLKKNYNDCMKMKKIIIMNV